MLLLILHFDIRCALLPHGCVPPCFTKLLQKQKHVVQYEKPSVLLFHYSLIVKKPSSLNKTDAAAVLALVSVAAG